MTDRPSKRRDERDSPPALHVLHVVDAGVFERFGRMFRQLGFALCNEGIRVSLLTDDAGAVEELDGTPVTASLLCSLSGWNAWRLLRDLPRRFPKWPDLVHLWGTRRLGTFSRWTGGADVPLLVHALGLRDVARLLRRGPRPHERALAGCSDFAERLSERWRETIAPDVAVPALLAPDEEPGLGPRGGTLGVVWTGRMDEHSGLEVLIDAIGRLQAREFALQAVLIGRGPATSRIWRRIRERKVEGRVSLVEGSRLWERALPGADVCVVPANQRELSLAPLLAMANGKIVLASRDQRAPWFIERETALLFTPGSAEELATLLTRVRDAHPDVPATARASAAYVRRHHAVTDLASRLLDLYGEAVAPQGGRPVDAPA